MEQKKSKVLVIYQIKKDGQFALRATKPKDPEKQSSFEFSLKSDEFGIIIPKNVTDEQLGKYVRQIIKNSD